MDNDTLLIKMAKDNEYLKPLKLFKNRVAFGNGKYDKLVSCSSALLLHGAEQAQFGLDFWDKMIRENNKFLIEKLSEKNDIDNQDSFCWFSSLRNTMEWKKIIVCWNQNKWSRNNCHPLLAAPFTWHSGSILVCNKIIENFQY